MVDQPGIAIRTVETETARPAQCEGRIAATIEKQQRLLAARQRYRDGFGQPRRNETSARWTLATHVDRFDRWQMCAPETLGQMHMPVTAAARIHFRFDRRGR